MADKPVKHKINIIDDRCKGCSFCIEFCPQHILYHSNETNAKGYNVIRVAEPEKCSGCAMCSRVCPEFAIYITPNTEEENKSSDTDKDK